MLNYEYLLLVYWYICVLVKMCQTLGTRNFFILSHPLIHGAKAPAPELLGTHNLELETHIPAPSFLLSFPPFTHPLIFYNLTIFAPYPPICGGASLNSLTSGWFFKSSVIPFARIPFPRP